ncbi:MAG: ATPase [Gammaproteobacteria bacterium]|nr:ATPase [Gammaproteobacteria bacterium]
MRLDAIQFDEWPNKAITLLGMSGVGKTTLANKLPKNNWFHYSGDYRIGTKYLEEPILDNIKKQAMQVDFLRDLLRTDSIYIRSNITVNNLEPLSAFLGKLGDPAAGGLTLEEFSRRQRLHHDAEVGAMLDVATFIDKAQSIYGYEHFINDAGGSVCELDDASVIEQLSAHTLLIYIEADSAIEQALIQRQRLSPKPLYYRREFFEAQLADFLAENKLTDVDEIPPDQFVLWMFPKLIAHRRPRYEAIAQEYGYTVSAHAVEQVQTEEDFLALVRDTLTTA